METDSSQVKEGDVSEPHRSKDWGVPAWVGLNQGKGGPRGEES